MTYYLYSTPYQMTYYLYSTPNWYYNLFYRCRTCRFFMTSSSNWMTGLSPKNLRLEPTFRTRSFFKSYSGKVRLTLLLYPSPYNIIYHKTTKIAMQVNHKTRLFSFRVFAHFRQEVANWSSLGQKRGIAQTVENVKN